MDNPADGTQNAKPTESRNSDPLIGKVLGNYKILRRLGSGGMASVYAARQASMERDVAIKVMRKELSDSDPTFFSRFEREARVTASLEHVHILPVIDFGQADEEVYLVMRLFDQSLLDYIKKNSPLSLEEVSRLLTQIAEALTYAHEHGVVHRDLKPANVMLDNQKNCYLSDFGIAHLGSGHTLTVEGMIVGTPGYLSPEQIAGGSASASSDIYALGIMLYEMITGRLPFSGDTPFIIMNQHLQTPPPLPSQWRHGLPDGAQAVIMKALAKSPQDRFRTPRDMAAAFARAIAEPGASATPKRPSRPGDDEPTYIGTKDELRQQGLREAQTSAPRATQFPGGEPTNAMTVGAMPATKRRSPGLLVGVVGLLVVLVLGGGAFALSNRATAVPTATPTLPPTATLDPAGAVPFNDAGVKALAKVDYTSAIKNFTEAIRIDPNYATAYFNLGVAYEEKGDLRNAQQSYEKAIALNDRLLLVRYRLAELLLDASKIDEAFKIIDLAVRIFQRGGVLIDDASRETLTFYLYTTRGRAYELRYEASKSKSDLTLAEDDLKQALTQKNAVKSPAEAFYYLAKVYDAEGRTADAYSAWYDVFATADPLNAREREWSAEASAVIAAQTPAATAAH